MDSVAIITKIGPGSNKSVKRFADLGKRHKQNKNISSGYNNLVGLSAEEILDSNISILQTVEATIQKCHYAIVDFHEKSAFVKWELSIIEGLKKKFVIIAKQGIQIPEQYSQYKII